MTAGNIGPDVDQVEGLQFGKGLGRGGDRHTPNILELVEPDRSIARLAELVEQRENGGGDGVGSVGHRGLNRFVSARVGTVRREVDGRRREQLVVSNSREVPYPPNGIQ